jgi:hypothetical protein
MKEKLYYLFYCVWYTPYFFLQEHEEFFLDHALTLLEKKKTKAWIPERQTIPLDFAQKDKKELIQKVKKMPHALVLGYTPKDFAYVYQIRS